VKAHLEVIVDRDTKFYTHGLWAVILSTPEGRYYTIDEYSSETNANQHAEQIRNAFLRPTDLNQRPK
jgi:hypothetical protein